MQKRTLGVILLAGLAMSGAGAFTASNTVPASVAGYGANTVTGATVTDIAYAVGADPSKLTSVVFTSSTNVTGRTATMTLRDGGTQVGSSHSCVLGVWSIVTSTMTITCATTEDVDAFDSVGLTVFDA